MQFFEFHSSSWDEDSCQISNLGIVDVPLAALPKSDDVIDDCSPLMSKFVYPDQMFPHLYIRITSYSYNSIPTGIRSSTISVPRHPSQVQWIQVEVSSSMSWLYCDETSHIPGAMSHWACHSWAKLAAGIPRLHLDRTIAGEKWRINMIWGDKSARLLLIMVGKLPSYARWSRGTQVARELNVHMKMRFLQFQFQTLFLFSVYDISKCDLSISKVQFLSVLSLESKLNWGTQSFAAIWNRRPTKILGPRQSEHIWVTKNGGFTIKNWDFMWRGGGNGAHAGIRIFNGGIFHRECFFSNSIKQPTS